MTTNRIPNIDLMTLPLAQRPTFPNVLRAAAAVATMNGDAAAADVLGCAIVVLRDGSLAHDAGTLRADVHAILCNDPDDYSAAAAEDWERESCRDF